MKRLLTFFGIACLCLYATGYAYALRDGFVNTVVIDPGHGGAAPGTVGLRSKEKDIALAISLRLGEYIREHLPEVKVVFTRETDESVTFARRAEIAHENHADLFISVHANGAASRAAHGTETFVMGLHRSQANLEVARKENADILLEEDYEETYGGFDPHSPEASIIFTLYQNAYLDQSLRLASLIQDEFRERARRVDRGVKQAGFLMLYLVSMPSVLIEAGFLTNREEEAFLMSENGQALIASAIFRAFRSYKEEQDALAANRIKPPAAPATSLTPLPASSPESVIETGDGARGVVFRVQFAASGSQRPADAPEFKGLEDVSWYFHEGLYKYTVGNETSLEAAAWLQAKVQEAGFRDAFVVAFLDGERITAEEAIRLISRQDHSP